MVETLEGLAIKVKSLDVEGYFEIIAKLSIREIAALNYSEKRFNRLYKEIVKGPVDSSVDVLLTRYSRAYQTLNRKINPGDYKNLEGGSTY